MGEVAQALLVLNFPTRHCSDRGRVWRILRPNRKLHPKTLDLVTIRELGSCFLCGPTSTTLVASGAQESTFTPVSQTTGQDCLVALVTKLEQSCRDSIRSFSSVDQTTNSGRATPPDSAWMKRDNECQVLPIDMDLLRVQPCATGARHADHDN